MYEYSRKMRFTSMLIILSSITGNLVSPKIGVPISNVFITLRVELAYFLSGC